MLSFVVLSGLAMAGFTLLAPRLVRVLAHRLVSANDARTRVPSDYLHRIIDTSLSAFFAFARFLSLAGYRRKLPKTEWHLVRLLATQVVDCGTCVQITVNLALRDGVSAQVIRAVIEGRTQQLEPALRDLCAFAKEVLAHSYAEAPLREQMRARYGEQGLIEIAYALASAQVFPWTKQVLGYGVSCARVRVELP